MESEFFGHKKGSFTGTIENKIGLFNLRKKALFLDRVADLPLAMQVKLLRAIQEKTVRPIGEQRKFGGRPHFEQRPTEDLAWEVEEGRFRQDLFYRINVIELKVPSLA